MKLFGTWGEIEQPLWQTYLERTPDYVIKEIGLPREELQKILEKLYEHRIIN